MAAKTWKCLMPGCPNRINDPTDQFRQADANTCAGCGRWRYLPHALAAGVLSALVVVIGGVVWLTGMPARSYATKYEAYLRNDQRIDEREAQELAKLVAKHRLSEETIAQIQDDVQQRMGLRAATAPQPQPSAADTITEPPRSTPQELTALLHNIYSDHLKTPEEQEALTAALQRQQLDAAAGARLEEQIKTRWQSAQPSFERGLTAVKQARYQVAIEEFQRALAADPDNAWIVANLGAAYLQANRPEDALASYRKALDLDARNWLAHYNLGAYHARRGNKDAALDALQQALQCVAEDRTQPITRADVVGQLRTDSSLKAIRQDARFQQLLARN